jgi:hypothetical protein
MDGQHSLGDWIMNFVLGTIGYITRLAFGDDKLSTRQTVAFFIFCGAVVFIIDKLPWGQTIKLSMTLCAGLVIPNIIKAVISGAKGSERSLSDRIRDWINKKSN